MWARSQDLRLDLDFKIFILKIRTEESLFSFETHTF